MNASAARNAAFEPLFSSESFSLIELVARGRGRWLFFPKEETASTHPESGAEASDSANLQSGRD
jgi:hypothetical protein